MGDFGIDVTKEFMGIVHVYNQSIRKKDPAGKVQDLHAWRLSRTQSAFNNLKAEYRRLKSQFCLNLLNFFFLTLKLVMTNGKASLIFFLWG